MKTILSFITLTLCSISLSGQCMMIPLSLESQMDKSDLVIEGEVMAKTSFETVAQNFIYTTYQIRITKVFKGTFKGDEIQMVEPGGIVGTRVIQVDPGVQLEVGTFGSFFLSLYRMKDARDNARFNQPVYRAHGSTQSVFAYDFTSNRATSVFINEPITDLYRTLQKVSGRKYKEVHPLNIPGASRTSMMMPSISNLSPLTITGGTYSVLTITGSDFGATMGTSIVQFRDPNDGGMSWYTASAAHITSWSNIQIQVRVPSRAGSGQVRVTVGGMSVTSSQSLAIGYSQSTFEFDVNGTQTVFQRHHFNHNGTGGYTFNYYTGFNSNNPARESFMRALNSWRCATQVHFIVGATTSINDDVEDDVNIVRFDVGTELAEGVGAHCVRYFGACALLDPYLSTPIQELDLVFNDGFPGGIAWEYGPALPSGTEIDFESIALHELGHAHSLDHVISPPEIMHYSIGPGESKRTLSASDIAGGSHVHDQSTGNPACEEYGPMTDYRRVRYVDHTATGTKSGDSWANALNSLQDALAVCSDSIYVAKGTYYPDEGIGLTNNDQTLRFNLNTAVVLTGGYPNGGGSRNLTANPTILSGDIEKDGFTDADNSQTVVRMSANAMLDGFYVERGYADGSSGEAKDGGGLFNSSTGRVRNSTFRYNRAQGTGSNGNGGAVFSASSYLTFENVLFLNNEATANGSAIYVSNTASSFRNCTIVKNLVGNNAVWVQAGCVYLVNSILAANPPAQDIAGAAGTCIDVSYSLLDDASLPPEGFGSDFLINTDPQFVDLTNHNFAIVPCSPAINSGSNGNNTTTVDILGNARFVGNIDRGAFENTTGPPSTLVTSTADSGPGSLRATITNACPGNTITFSPSLMNQTIVITGTQFVLSKNVTIQGLGINNLTISGDESRRIFNVNAGVTATIRDISLIECNATIGFGNCIRSFGNLTLQNMKMRSYSGAEFTLSLLADDGTLTFRNQVILE